MRILTLGAGPLGSIFTRQLVEAGHDVTLLARGRAHNLKTPHIDRLYPYYSPDTPPIPPGDRRRFPSATWGSGFHCWCCLWQHCCS